MADAVIIKIKKWKGLSLALCFAILCGCSLSPPTRQWEIHEIASECPSFYSGKMVLKQDSEFSRIEVEISRNRFGIQLYLNLFCTRAFPCEEDSKKTEIYFLAEEGDEKVFFATILEGEQRLLLSLKDSAAIIQTLVDGRTSVIQIGRITTTLIPDTFAPLYQQLLALPIPEICVDSPNFLID
jgi:hypothetical protein